MGTYSDKLLSQLRLSSSMTEQYELVSELLEEGLKCASIANQCGLADYQIRHMARLHRKLSAPVKELFLQGKLSFSLARAIAGLPEKLQENAARRAIAKHTSVHAFRLELQKNTDKEITQHLERLSEQASVLSGLDIKIVADKHNSRAGSWIVRYTDLTMFDTIVEILTGHSSLED